MMFPTDLYSNSMPISPLTTKWKYNNIEIAPNCPRCASSNTKFCYYNNYSLSQPRYFCKACRRYWTKGGSLRNVPVGGGCRKRQRTKATTRPAGSHTYADSAASTTESAGACIDIDAIFAKYVNHNLEVEESMSTSDNGQGSCTTFDVDSRLQEEIMTTFECQKSLEDLMGDQMMMPDMSTCQDVNGQQHVYNEFELQQGILCDHAEGIFWLEGTTPIQNLGMVPVEDCGLFALDDEKLRISANLVTENWDLSAYDFYSNP